MLQESPEELSRWRKIMADKFTDKSWDNLHPRIMMQEHLTHANAMLLKYARTKAKQLHYGYPGYVVEGQIRVRKKEGMSFISIKSIKCERDLAKIT